MKSPKDLFAMDEAGIKRNIDALAKVGINAPAGIFDLSFLAEASNGSTGFDVGASCKCGLGRGVGLLPTPLPLLHARDNKS
jgi:hypothetical protein